MKKINRKGFTLIELLAVITIMGILMVVAIPAISRTIENTRRDSFLDTAKQYANGVKTMWTSDSLECTADGTNYVLASGLADGTYYVNIDSAKVASNSGVGSGTAYPIILEQGGTSSWANKPLTGYVKIVLSGSGTGTAKAKYYVYLTDGIHGIDSDDIEFLQLKRGQVETDRTSWTAKTVGTTICREI